MANSQRDLRDSGLGPMNAKKCDIYGQALRHAFDFWTDDVIASAPDEY